MSEARGLFGWIGVVVQRWPWAVIGFWIALAAVLSVTIPPLTEMASQAAGTHPAERRPGAGHDETDLPGVQPVRLGE